MTFTCIIVDDEPLAQSVIETYLNNIKDIELKGKFDNAIDAMNYLNSNKVDLMFLDINMPELNGMDMLKSLAVKPEVILTTAYSEYAIESYELGVSDYLLKPIALPRFLKAVNKVINNLSKEQSFKEGGGDKPRYVFIKVDGINLKLSLEDIRYIEAYGNYLKVYTSEKMYLITDTMINFMTLLDDDFIRVHKSYIVPLSKIEKLVGNRVHIGEDQIPIGNTYKSDLKSKITNK
ncbi:MAG: response regulator transcription factor [Ichthyobacteriaceae bacterium]|nr:response regulator transcription factor [Ichthyobacteriaceae bacterium]